MPINRPQPPVSALAALIDGLAAFLSDEDHEKAREIVRGGRAVAAPEIPSAAKLGFQPGKLTVPIADYNPIEVFALSIDNVMRGLPLRSAVSSAGWRFFVSQPGSNHVVMAWVFQQPPAGAWKIAAVFYGPEVARLKDVSNGLDRYENAGDLRTLSLLIAPSINFQGILLTPQNDESGTVIVPFPNMDQQLIGGMDKEEFPTEAEFLAVVRSVIPRWKSAVPHSGG